MTEETVFSAALEKADPADRAALVEAACAGDPALRVRVDALLKSHADGEFLARSPFAGVVSGVLAEPPTNGLCVDARVGRYRLLREIGEGGMGVVWEAEQTEPLRRLVALKVVRPGMDSRGVVARLMG